MVTNLAPYFIGAYKARYATVPICAVLAQLDSQMIDALAAECAWPVQVIVGGGHAARDEAVRRLP